MVAVGLASAPTYSRDVLPEPPPLLPPTGPPPNGRPWAPVAALALILALFAATVGGSVVFSRLIAAGLAVHVINDPTTVPLPAVPTATPSPGAPDAAALQALLAATPATPSVEIDETLARQIVTALWPVREQAIDTGDIASLSTFESGPALEGDTSLYGNRPCGCAPQSPRPMEWLYLFVPKQTAYPADFLAEVTMPSVGASRPGVVLLVLTRESSLTHWNVTLATQYTNSITGPPVVYVAPLPPSGGVSPLLPATHVHLTALPTELAAYYQHWAASGRAPANALFAPSVFTSYKGGQVFVYGETNEVNGIHHVVYSAEPATDGEWSFVGESFEQAPQYGWILSCGTVRYEDVSTPAVDSAALNQPPDQSTWGSTLPPGRYSQITQWGLHESCFAITPTGAPTLVLGIDGGPIRSTGVLVSAEP